MPCDTSTTKTMCAILAKYKFLIEEFMQITFTNILTIPFLYITTTE